MGIGDFFKKRFGKQICAFCGQEVGMMKRDKIKNDEFICSDCKRTCSRHIQVYRFTKDELLGHMEYMKRQGKLVESISELKGYRIPSASRQGIIFYDEVGMFRVYNGDKDSKYPMEMIRYDQVAKYEPYCVETEPSEAGKPKEFKEGGVKITLVGGQADLSQMPKGLRAHPYITTEITIQLDKSNMIYVDNIIHHFDGIFGVNDDRTGLFNRRPSKQKQREQESMLAMTGMFTEAIKVAKNGGEVSEESVAKFNDAMEKAADAETRGLAKYSRLADEAEAKI